MQIYATKTKQNLESQSKTTCEHVNMNKSILYEAIPLNILRKMVILLYLS